MSIRSAYARQKSADDRRGYILIAASVLAVAGAAAGLYYGAEPKRDPRTGCPINLHAAPVAHTLILVDQTDAFPKKELKFARELIRNEYFWLPIDGRLTVRNIVADVEDGHDEIVVCRLRDASEGNGITNTPAALQRQYETMVGGRLDAFLDKLSDAPVQARSPIVEAIADVYARSDFGHDVKTRRLVVLSDMAQHSADYTQYGRNGSGRYTIAPDAIEEYATKMDGSAVRVQYINRRTIEFQGSRHKRFWKEYFKNQGADVAVGHGLQLGEADDRDIYHADASTE